jgi:chromosomal replication initiator protein
MNTLAHWIETPESRMALPAIRRVLECVCSQQKRREINPLFLHGPAGTGKTHLVSALVTEMMARRPDVVATVLASRDLNLALRPDAETIGPPSILQEAREADLLVLEDLQNLDPRTVEAMVGVIDDRMRRQQQIVCTATNGPGRLRHLPARLTSRLAVGLVVGLAPLSPESRRTLLRQLAGRKKVSAPAEVLDWVADNVGGSVRQLEGALGRLETLARLRGQLADLTEIQAAFQEDADARHLTVERIAQRVGRHYQLEPRELQARDRSRHILLPRQVGMYLARKLTRLSLEQIGAYFGGRDHSTVLHACRKVEQALDHDPALSGVVRQLHADLS